MIWIFIGRKTGSKQNIWAGTSRNKKPLMRTIESNARKGSRRDVKHTTVRIKNMTYVQKLRQKLSNTDYWHHLHRNTVVFSSLWFCFLRDVKEWSWSLPVRFDVWGWSFRPAEKRDVCSWLTNPVPGSASRSGRFHYPVINYLYSKIMSHRRDSIIKIKAFYL